MTLDGPTAGATLAEYARDAQRHARDRRRAETPRAARVAAPLDGDRARAARARLRRGDDGGSRRAGPALGAPSGLAARLRQTTPGAAHRSATHGRPRSRSRARRSLGPCCSCIRLRALEHRDGLPARRDDRGLAARPPAVGAHGRAERALFFDFFFVPPRFTFAVADVQYVVTFGVMLTIALVIATLMASVRQQTRVAGARERRTALLYAMSRELAGDARHRRPWRASRCSHVTETFRMPMPRCCCRTIAGRLQLPARDRRCEGSYRGADLAVAQWVADHGRRAGLGSDTLPAAPALYLPLSDGPRDASACWRCCRDNRRRVLLPEQRHLLETFAGQIALALERAELAENAESRARRGRDARACATRCSPRSRTTCARRSR